MATSSVEAQRGVRAQILVVDDDRDARQLLATTFELAGHEVIQPGSADEALRTLAAETCDAVVLDRSMPGMGGIECLDVIRRTPATARLPVVMVTAASQVADVVSALDRGADDYVVKPFSADELVARVMRHVRGRAEWTSLLRDEIDRRTSLLAAAATASATTSLDEGARDLTDELHSIAEVAGVAITEVVGDGVSTLAMTGVDPVATLIASTRREDLGSFLSARATLGPWLEAVNDPRTAGVVSVVPIRVDEIVVGLVLTLPDQSATRSDIDRIHATAMDFALLATAVFGSQLLDTSRREDERRDLIDPIERGAFTTVFQPVLCLETGNVVGHEALTRFGNGADTAQTFARAARLGLTRLLEMRTLEAAIAQSPALPDDEWLAVNVSPSVLLQEDLRDRLQQAGDRSVLLELSEVEPVVDYDAVRAAVDALGPTVSLSVDDAGAGFASLAHVLALRATYVKIDRSWISGIEHDPAKRALVAGIGNFAAESGALVIAEGIETEPELETVRSLDIHLGQGYLLGRPAPL